MNQTVIWRHFYLCDTDIDSDNEIDTVQTGCTQWTDCTHIRPTRAIIQSFTRCGGGVQWVETERSAGCHGRLYEHCTFSCSSLKLCRCWWKRHIHVLSRIFGRAWRRARPSAWRDYSGNVLLCICYCADGAQSDLHTERLLVHTRTVLYGL